MTKTERVEFRARGEELKRWEACAESMKVSLSQWIRMALNAKAKRGPQGWTAEQWRSFDSGNVPVYTPTGKLFGWEVSEKLTGDGMGYILGDSVKDGD